MDAAQISIYEMFVELGDKRNIPKLYALCNEQNLGVTRRQLERWCLIYRWREQAKKSTATIARKTEEVLLEDSISRARKLISGLRSIQDRFIVRVAIDPLDPKLTDEQRQRAIDPDFRDFQEAVKLERLILGDPTERREDVTTSRLVVELGESELLAAARSIAAKRYGLPTEEDIKAIKDRAEVPIEQAVDA